MPLFEYECRDCGAVFEVLQNRSDDPPDACESCGAPHVTRIMSQSAFHLKGSGWYKTDYAAASKSSASSKPASSSSDKGGSSTDGTGGGNCDS